MDLHVERYGAGKPAVFIHGASGSSLSWYFQKEYLKQFVEVILLDLPGHGKSLLDRFKPLESIHAFAEVLWNLLRTLHLGRPVVVGCSIGGDIALDLAVHHSPEIPAVVACQAAAFTPTFPSPIIDMGLEDSGVPSYSDQGSLSGLSACGSKADKERVAEIVWTRRLGDPKIYYSDLKAWIKHDLRPNLAKVSCPVLCVWGNEDYFVPRPLVEETVAGIPNSRLEILEGIGHYPHLETREFNPLVERFLQSLGIGKGKGSKN